MQSGDHSLHNKLLVPVPQAWKCSFSTGHEVALPAFAPDEHTNMLTHIHDFTEAAPGGRAHARSDSVGIPAGRSHSSLSSMSSVGSDESPVTATVLIEATQANWTSEGKKSDGRVVAPRPTIPTLPVKHSGKKKSQPRTHAGRGRGGKDAEGKYSHTDTATEARNHQRKPSTPSQSAMYDEMYTRAKKLQLVDKDLEGARVLFEEVLKGGGSKLDSALKDLVTVLRQLGRHEEAGQVIHTYRDRCSERAQTSLDNMQLELFKCLKDYESQITVAERLLYALTVQKEQGDRAVVVARNAMGKFEVSAEHKMARLFGIIGWAKMQLNNWEGAEAAYSEGLKLSRKANAEEDAEMQVNRSVCLIKRGCFVEAQNILLSLLAQARGLQNGGSIKGVAGSALATKRRVLAVLRQLEAEYERLLGQLKSELNEQDQLESLVTAVDTLVCDEDEDDAEGASTQPGTEPRKKNRGTTGRRREGESLWASQARLGSGFEQRRQLTYNVIDEHADPEAETDSGLRVGLSMDIGAEN